VLFIRPVDGNQAQAVLHNLCRATLEPGL